MDAYRTVIMSTGQRIRIEIPVNVQAGTVPYGVFKYPYASINWAGTQRPLTNGFLSEDETIGTLEAINNCVGVYYTHLQGLSNKIYFFTNMDEIFLIEILPMGIHDHSSIGQGGPAHGTYASEADLQA